MSFLFLVLLLLLCKPVEALYNGNPALVRIPEEGFYFAKEAWLSLRLGYEGDLVFDRKMNRHIQRFKIFENFGTLTTGFVDRCELYGSVGSFSTEVRQQTGSRRLEWDTRSSLSWKVGGRLLAWESGDTFLTVHAGYQQTPSSRLRSITLNGEPLERNGAKLFYHEIGGSVGVAHRIDLFLPYIGVEGSYAKARIRNIPGQETLHVHSRSPVGLFLGCGFSPGTKVIVNVEVRLVDEQAVTLSGDLRF